MVTETVPVAAPAAAVSVSELVLVVGFVPKDAVTPLGKPEADRVTLPVKPLVGLTVIVLPPLAPPCTSVTFEGEAESEKLGVGAEACQAFNRLATLMLPMPVAKSHPVFVP